MEQAENENLTEGVDRETLIRLKSELTKLHHDLQNPLSVLTGNVELVNALSQEIEVDPGVKQSLDDIYEASVQLTTLLARLKSMRTGITD